VLLTLLQVAFAFHRTCPVTESPVNDESPSVVISGVEFRFKSADLVASFAKSPAEVLGRQMGGGNNGPYSKSLGQAFGVSFFDPVARKSMILSRDGHIREADIKAVSNWEWVDGIIYPLSQRSARLFRQDPRSYLVEPKKYTLWCPVMRKEMPSIEKAIGYLDRDEVRYFLCCESCMGSAGRSSGPGWAEALEKAVDWVKLRG
jgi:hypothetical protein